MRLGLSMGMEMRQEPRMELEQKLEQSLKMQMKQEITLELYLEQENLIKSFVRWAEENNSWESFGKEGFSFNYAKIPYKIAKPIADIAGPGFAHCLYNSLEALICGKKQALAKGDWTLFVVNDMIPQELKEFIALHERGEEISLGNHHFASQLEFAFVKKNNKTKKYVNFINKKYPSSFLDLTQEIKFPVLPQELRDFLENQGKRNKQELDTAEKLIKKYPLPISVLILIDKYDKKTEQICDLIKDKISAEAENSLYKFLWGAPYVDPEKAANLVNDIYSRILLSISPEDARVIASSKVNELLDKSQKTMNRYMVDKIRKGLEMETDFQKAYEKSKKGEKLVRVY